MTAPHKHECGHCDGLAYECMTHDVPCTEEGCEGEEDECEVRACDNCNDGEVYWDFEPEDTGLCHECKAEDVKIQPSGDRSWVCEKCLRAWHDGWHPDCKQTKKEDGARADRPLGPDDINRFVVSFGDLLAEMTWKERGQ